ncbi:MAG: ATP-binding protein, partial [Candidatus Tenebribacter mawsonii]|nr:ATP-binding protein [Candidatus Tenebribacter mawsonii]
MFNTETFRISAALKDLIGKELITDEFVAVFELVKNSFDANAKNVKIIFENNYDEINSKIIILDDGIGMNYKDLKSKWLFVAYSAKRLGKEYEDYRNKIKTNRVFAGAKGVGRFS